jgi:membrane protease YdiL (CAAX protease family)
LSWREVALLVTPPLLLVTTYATFQERTNLLGPIGGYLAGFLFYWIGLIWGWVARRSGGIQWPVVSHILFDFARLGGRVYL